MEQGVEEKKFELRKKIQALEWDIKYNRLPKERVFYYNKLLEQFNELCGTDADSGEFKEMEIKDE